MPPAFGAAVREQLEPVLRDVRGMQVAWSTSSGDWIHLELRPDAPTGFVIAVNAGPEYALVIVAGRLSREFTPPPPGASASEVVEHAKSLAAFVVHLLGPGTRVRELRAGLATYQWRLEQQVDGGGWEPIARW